ncbi:AAA family ATPase [Haliea sp. E17]|uniref:ExeA family protein n=1 Tax=Haliea sp. E17 TaxID=3401576 RepID=UPI003AB04AAD
MYHQYFGLSEAPFSIAVNPRYLYMSARHRDALAHLLYGVGAGGGFILLTGEVGTGKTTVNRCLLEQLPDDTDVAIILNPALNAIELLASVCDELGIAYPEGDCTLKSLTDRLHRFLLDNHARGRKTVLMIDEAQHLDFAVLEQIRLLTNLETNSEKLLQIILIGQPELAQLLARPELRQLNQRITARYDLGPLNLAETRAYIQHRLQVAGMAADRELFPPRVVRGIFQRTRGIPRLINVLCDRILLGAYGRNKGRADMATLQQAAREVMGDQGQQRKHWPWVLAALLLALAGLAGWAYYAGMLPPPVASAVAPAADTAVAAPAADLQPVQVPPNPPLAEGAVQPDIPPPTTAAATGAMPAVSPAGLPGNGPALAGGEMGGEMGGPSTVAPSSSVQWLLPPGDAQALLWSLTSAEPYPGDPCGGEDIACAEGEARTWAELAVLHRPLLLEMVTPERFAAATLLLDIEGRQAWVATASGVQLVDLALLAPLWQGRYHYVWHTPYGFQQAVALGDSGPVVAQIAELFAQLDGQAEPLANTRFNTALQQRVKLFQRSKGLEDDGVVGLRTLLVLNRALGIDPTAEQARMALAATGQQAGAAPAAGSEL